MSQALAKKTIWAAAVAFVLGIFVIFIGLPFVASTQLVRDRIAQQMTAWTGYRVSIDEAPDVHVWPTFRAVLKDVRLQGWTETSEQPVLEAEEIEVDLSALAALQGEVVFTRMRLLRPILRLNEDITASQFPSSESWGRLARSVRAAKEAVAASPETPDLSTLPSYTLGEIEFVEARILSPVEGQWVDVVSSLSGELDWPALNRAANLSARGIWHGEAVTVRANSAQPLLLVAGGNAPLALTVEASPAKISFEGTAGLSNIGVVEGQLELTAPSLNRLAEWTYGLRLPTGRIGPLALSAHLSGDASRIKLETSNLAVDASSGRGLLEVSFEADRPSVIGTLAFDVLNLRALAQALGPLKTNGSATNGGASIISGLDFDLRFSAASATFGTIPLTKVAAVAKTKGELSTFDISDAMGLGGNFQVGVRADKTAEPEQLELRLSGTDIELGQLAETFGRRNLIPQGKANLSVFLKGTGGSVENLLSTANGDVSATFGPGALPGIDLTKLLEESDRSTFIPLYANTDGSISLDSADIKATVKNGLAEISFAKVHAGEYSLTLNGLVPVAGRALALSAVLTDTTDEDLHFFVGGSWDAPFITAPLRFGPDDLAQ